jgi:NADPH:quinone reductase-like Zn-dependent oxidoreductase
VRKSQPNGIAGIVHTSGDTDAVAALSALVNEGGYVTSMRGGAKVEDLARRNLTGINIQTMTTTAALERLAALVESGKLKRPEIKTFKLEDANQAFDDIATGHVRGKLVVTV